MYDFCPQMHFPSVFQGCNGAFTSAFCFFSSSIAFAFIFSFPRHLNFTKNSLLLGGFGSYRCLNHLPLSGASTPHICWQHDRA